MLEIENQDQDIKKRRKIDEFKAQAEIIKSKTDNKQLFKLLKNLYTLCEWTLNETDHDERKQLIKEVLKDVSNDLIDELTDQIFEMNLFSRRTRWKKVKSKFRRCFRARCEDRD